MKKIIVLVATLLVGVVFMAATPNAHATTQQDICSGVTLTGGSCSDTTSFTDIIKTIISVLSLIVGITAVIFVILGGFKFITSSGDAQKAASARNTILYAVVGLVVAALAQAIVAFVLTKANTAATTSCTTAQHRANQC
jgi:uncharacterized membrane protein